jgi:putative salt-induced outer membrane protein YdiY
MDVHVIGEHMRLKQLIIFLILLLSVCPVHLYASVPGHIQLQEGSLLKGQIYGMSNGILRVSSSSSLRNPIPLRWKDVTGLWTEEPVILILEGGVKYTGRVRAQESGSIQIITDKNTAPLVLALNSIKAIKDPKGKSRDNEDPDEIILENGTRVLGTIEFMEDGKLTVKTSYSDDLVIEWDEVDKIYSHAPLSVEVIEEDGDPDGDGFWDTYYLNARTLTESDSLSFDRVDTINVPDYRYKGQLDIGGNDTKGNSEATAFNASADGRFWTERHRALLFSRFAFASADGEDETENARGGLRYDYSFTKKFFATIDELLEYDRFQDLDIRSSTTVGVGYQVFDMDSHHLSGTLGPGYVYQKNNNGSTKTSTFSWGVLWDYELIADRLKVYHRQKGYRDLGGDGSTAVRLLSEQGAHLELIGDLYFKLSWEYRYNSDPEDDKKKSDRALIWALGYTFGN